MVSLSELRAVQAAKDGDTAPLAALIRSGVELSRSTREVTAKLVEGKSAKGRGRPQGDALRTLSQSLDVAFEVKLLKDEKGIPLRPSTGKEGAFAIVARRYSLSASGVEKLYYRYRHCFDE